MDKSRKNSGKSGCLASFRGSITYQNEDDAMTAGHDGRITLKLFNLLISEMGPAFLAHGIWVSGRMLLDFLAAHPLEPRRLFKEIKKNGEDIDPERFNDLDWISPEGRIFLQGACDPHVSAAT